MFLFIAISFLILSFYLLLISGFYYSWKKAIPYKPGNQKDIYISVVIPFYNEEKKLRSLISSIKRQLYPPDKFELIIVDDYSTDSSCILAEKLVKDVKNMRMIRNKGKKGKKYALHTGIMDAKSEYILISDADCNFNPEWISVFASYFTDNPDLKLVSSGVLLEAGSSFQENYQALEFSSLIATGAASFFQNEPVMCNGANLAFRKSLFIEAFEYLHPEVNTGDDIFLMLYTKKKYPEKHGFIKNPGAFTITSPSVSWMGFFRQRIRWSSKSNMYRDFRLIYIASIVLLTNLILPAFLILSILDQSYLLYFLLLFFIKSIPDYLFLRNYLVFTGQRDLLKFFLPSQLLNMFFIPLTGISGIIIPPTGMRAK